MDLVEEFLKDGWPTYALAELSREDQELMDNSERLDRLTTILAKGNQAALEKAQTLLGAWLRRKDNQTHHMCGPFRLRRALLLRKLKDYTGAIVEAERLLQADPESAALNCFLADLYESLITKESWKRAVEYNRKAIELDDNWPEPRLGMLFSFFFLGMDDKQYWQQIVDQARNWLEQRSGMTHRERLILWTFRVVAAVLLNPAHIKSDAYTKERSEAHEIAIPPMQRESWDNRDIYATVVKPHFSADDPLIREARMEVWKLLGEAHSKLVTETQWPAE